MDSLRHEAQKKLEAKDYVGAREAYRELIAQTASEVDFLLLGIAENHELLAFRQALRLKHPQSLFAWLAEIQANLPLGRRGPAIDLATEALNIFLDIEDQFMLRSLRLKAASDYYFAVQQYMSLILEDIRALWQVDSKLLIEPRDKQGFLSYLISSLESRHLPILETLAQDEMFPPVVRQAFEAKIAQLRALDEALKAL
jgi:hypothetical protein